MLPLALGFSGFLGTAHNRLQKFVLIADSILGKALDFSENDLFQKIYSDIVRGGTGSAISTIVRTVEILDIVIALVEVVIQIVPTVRANQEAAEDVPLRILRFALTHLAALFLNLFPDSAVNNGFVNILEHHPILPGVVDPLFVLVRLGIGLKVQNVSAILLDGQHLNYSGLIPLGRPLQIPLAGAVDSLLVPIGPVKMS